MWRYVCGKGGLEKWREGTVSGRGKVRRGERGGEGEIERGREGGEENNGVLRGLVFRILTSQFVCVCMCVCVCV